MLLFYFFLSETKRDLFYKAIILSAFFILLFSLHAHLTSATYLKEKNISWFTSDFLSRKRLFFPFVLPAHLAGFLSMVMFFHYRTVSGNFLKIGGSLFFFIGLLLTQSVGAVFSFLASVFLYLLIKKRYKKILLFFFFSIFLLALVFFLRLQYHKEFNQPYFSLLKRIEYFKETLRIISNYPFQGVGVGLFSLKNTMFSHNLFLQLWAEAGFLSFALFFIICVCFIKEGMKIKEDKDFYIFMAGISFLMHNLVDFTFFTLQVSFLWWICLGVIFSKCKQNCSQGA